MKQRRRIHYTESRKVLMWARWQRGESLQLCGKSVIGGSSAQCDAVCGLLALPVGGSFSKISPWILSATEVLAGALSADDSERGGGLACKLSGCGGRRLLQTFSSSKHFYT